MEKDYYHDDEGVYILILTKEELEQLNAEMRVLLPTLKTRLREQFGSQLDAWLAVGESKGVYIRRGTDSFDADWIIERVRDEIRNIYYLDMDGWDGIGITASLSDEDEKALKDLLLNYLDLFMPTKSGDELRNLISEVRENRLFNDEDHNDAVFFVFGALETDGQPKEMGLLWILENDRNERHQYMFEADTGARICEGWYLVSDLASDLLCTAMDEQCDYIAVEDGG